MDKTIGGIGWIEIGTPEPEVAERFYGGLFGWKFERDGDERVDYRELTTPGTQRPSGGILNHGGQAPNYAVFCVRVADVPATLKQAESLGGTVIVPPTEGGNGLVFAHLTDPGGSQLAIYSAPNE